jgi:DNA-binding beta-propeller fold protein YncE
MKNKKIAVLSLLALSLFLEFGCKKENSSTSDQFYENGTFILCEGAFQQGNARIDFLNKTSENLKTDIFGQVNNIPLGDILQSMSVINDKAFLVVNNSGKIEVTDPKTMKIITSITGFTSPRYICQVSPAKAYVSDLFGGALNVLDLNSLTVTGSVPLPGWTEEMWNHSGEIWVTNGNRNHVYIVENDQATDSIPVGYGSNSIREDVNGKAWVLTGGNYSDNTPSKLVKINPYSRQMEWETTLDSYGASKLRMTSDGSVLYFLYNGVVYRKNTGDDNPPAVFISMSGNYFYGIGINPENGDIWLGDAGDFSSAGTVLIFNSAGTLLKQFTTGVAPSDFVF